MEKLYKVQMNSNGMPNFSTAVEVADRPPAPSIDICFCRECKYRKHRVDFQNDYCIQHSKVLYSTDGYCSWGEREGE